MTERRAITGSWIAAIAISVAFFFAADAYALRLGTLLAMYVALASGWNIIGGMAGYPSFATAAFFGLGAYAGALVQQKGVPMPLAWSFGALVPAVTALAIGWVVLRLRGHYFAIASFAVAIVLRELTTNWTSLTGGGMGVNLPVLQISVIEQARLFFAAQTTLAAIAAAISALSLIRAWGSRSPASGRTKPPQACSASTRAARRPPRSRCRRRSPARPEPSTPRPSSTSTRATSSTC